MKQGTISRYRSTESVAHGKRVVASINLAGVYGEGVGTTEASAMKKAVQNWDHAQASMKLYIAGRDFKSAKTLMTLLEGRGHTITADWTGTPAGTRTPEAAQWMLDGVREADALVLDGVQEGMLGALLETGIALGAGKPVVILDDKDFRDSLFWCLPNVLLASTFAELQAALETTVQ